MKTRRSLLLIPILLLAGLPAFGADFSFAEAPELPAGVSPEIAALLDPSGVQIKGSDGTVVAEYWGRKAEFEGEPAAGFGLRFDHMPEGALIALVCFAEKGSDFREQSIATGVYTLRYSLHPEDGNHMGVAPSRDFAVLIPADEDSEPKENHSYDKVVELAVKAGNPHPTIVRLTLPEGDEAPHLWVNDYEHQVLDLMIGGMTVGVVVYGHSDE